MNTVMCPSCYRPTPTMSGQCMKCRAPIPAELLAAPPPGEPTAEGQTADTPQGYPVEPYTGTPGGSMGGVAVAIVVGAVGAVALGFVTAIIESFMWFVVVFAILYGLLLGGVTGVGAWLAKCRLKTELHVAGGIVGVIGLFTLHFSAYQIVIFNNPGAAMFSFWEFLDLRCAAGTTIGGIELGYVGSAIYWLAEGAIIVGLSAATATWAVERPFCAACNVWKEKRKLGEFRIDGGQAMAAIASGHPSMMVAPPTADERVTLSISECPRCRSAGSAVVEVVCVYGSGDKTVRLTTRGTFPGEAVIEFEKVAEECRRQAK